MGKSPTGLQYFAWPMGPVPHELLEEFGHPRSDILKLKEMPDTDPDFNYHQLTIQARTKFDELCFTRRELGVMKPRCHTLRVMSL